MFCAWMSPNICARIFFLRIRWQWTHLSLVEISWWWGDLQTFPRDGYRVPLVLLVSIANMTIDGLLWLLRDGRVRSWGTWNLKFGQVFSLLIYTDQSPRRRHYSQSSWWGLDDIEASYGEASTSKLAIIATVMISSQTTKMAYDSARRDQLWTTRSLAVTIIVRNIFFTYFLHGSSSSIDLFKWA